MGAKNVSSGQGSSAAQVELGFFPMGDPGVTTGTPRGAISVPHEPLPDRLVLDREEEAPAARNPQRSGPVASRLPDDDLPFGVGLADAAPSTPVSFPAGDAVAPALPVQEADRPVLSPAQRDEINRLEQQRRTANDVLSTSLFVGGTSSVLSAVFAGVKWSAIYFGGAAAAPAAGAVAGFSLLVVAPFSYWRASRLGHQIAQVRGDPPR